MITLESCPICNSKNIFRYRKMGTSPLVLYEFMPNVKVNVAIITIYYECQDCKLIFQNPRMSEKELNDFYSQGYYRKSINMTDEEMDEDELYRAKYDANIIKKYVKSIKSHIDIGGSRGFLLEAVGANNKVIVEENTNYIRVKGIETYSRIDQVLQTKFDLVTAIHVIEHITNPFEYLICMSKLLNMEGHLVVEVPTWESPGGPLRLPHLYHFEPDVLMSLCKKAGFYVVHQEYTPHLMLICTLRENN